MRPILPVRSRQYLRLLFAIAFFSSLGIANAADPVEVLQQILLEGPNVQNQEEMAAYQKKLEEHVKAMQRAGDLRRSLLLGMLRAELIAQQAGNPADEEGLLGKAYQKVRSDLVKRLQDVLRDSLRSKDATRRLATITFLAEMVGD